jgi:hypothetical protein
MPAKLRFSILPFPSGVHAMKYCLIIAGLCLLTFLTRGVLQAEQPPSREKSVTVYPVVITPAENIGESIPKRIAEVVGVMLERAGMQQIELGTTIFSPPETNDPSELATAFGEFVAKESLKTEFAVFGQILGTPQTGPKEIRTIVVDKTGKEIFADLADQEAFSRSKIKPKDPMTASLFLVDRLGSVWELADPQRQDAPEGKMAEVLRKRSGVPSEEELAAMNARLEAAKDKIASSKVTVYPIHLWKGWDRPSAVELAEMLNKQGICQAEASEGEPQVTIPGDPNQQKVLWDAARSFREHLQNNPPETEYALLVDYGLSAKAEGQRAANHVHVILCERSGDWVLADYQNSHHSDFQSITPKTPADCNRLAAIRLKRRLAE